jgi:hypothetical protein
MPACPGGKGAEYLFMSFPKSLVEGCSQEGLTPRLFNLAPGQATQAPALRSRLKQRISSAANWSPTTIYLRVKGQDFRWDITESAIGKISIGNCCLMFLATHTTCGTALGELPAKDKHFFRRLLAPPQVQPTNSR